MGRLIPPHTHRAVPASADEVERRERKRADWPAVCPRNLPQLGSIALGVRADCAVTPSRDDLPHTKGKAHRLQLFRVASAGATTHHHVKLDRVVRKFPLSKRAVRRASNERLTRLPECDARDGSYVTREQRRLGVCGVGVGLQRQRHGVEQIDITGGGAGEKPPPVTAEGKRADRPAELPLLTLFPVEVATTHDLELPVAATAVDGVSATRRLCGRRH
mmetsp:Transcript_66527/g.148496  ORF Transcript_66527/g.148496 Transcript_66527/m.148496 type:complete len:218 (-) Transcript_66527:644-1297(-)